jgi:hypothetical protein
LGFDWKLEILLVVDCGNPVVFRFPEGNPARTINNNKDNSSVEEVDLEHPSFKEFAITRLYKNFGLAKENLTMFERRCCAP